MSPEELTGQSTGAPNIGSLLGGAAAAPQAQPTAGMNSLLAGYGFFLALCFTLTYFFD
jgi:hypothetical protein